MGKKSEAESRLTKAEQWFKGQMPSGLVNHDQAGLPDGMRMRNENTRVQAEERFLERDEHFRTSNHHLTPSILFSSTLGIIYPSVPGYGPDHGKFTSQLATYIAQVEGLHDSAQLETLKAAGLLYDLGRTRPYNLADPECGARSAEKADRFIRMDPTGSAMGQMRQAVCTLIAQHHQRLSIGKPNADPLSRALWDADMLETARHQPNTPDGRNLITARFKLLVNPWCLRKPTQARWLRKYGWDLKKWGFDEK